MTGLMRDDGPVFHIEARTQFLEGSNKKEFRAKKEMKQREKEGGAVTNCSFL